MTLPPPHGESDAAAHPPVAAQSALSTEPGTVPMTADLEWIAAPRPRPRSRAVLAWSIGLSLAVVAIAAGALIHTNANLAFDDALLSAQAASADAQEASDEVSSVADDAADEIAASESIVAAAADDLVDPVARAALADATALSSAGVGDARSLLERPVPTPDDDKPLWTWELFDAVPGFEAQAGSLEDLASDLTSAGAAIDTADEQLDAAAAALYASVAPAADALEAANLSARNVVVIEFRSASDAATQQSMLDTGATTAFDDYAAKAANLKASAQAQLETKAGPLYGTRLDVEAFARSIAGGVLLEFDWAPYVNGVGGRTGISGTATWNTASGGFSTITLSNSVAELWPTPPAKALVAHEVGHAITSKCHEMFDSANQAANEAWATAWAISMGHTDDGNGVQAYGYPPQDLIATAATCR